MVSYKFDENFLTVLLYRNSDRKPCKDPKISRYGDFVAFGKSSFRCYSTPLNGINSDTIFQALNFALFGYLKRQERH